MKKITLLLFTSILLVISLFTNSIVKIAAAEESAAVVQEGVTLTNLIDHPKLETFDNNYVYKDGENYYNAEYQLIALKLCQNSAKVNFATKYNSNKKIEENHKYFFYFESEKNPTSTGGDLYFNINGFEDGAGDSGYSYLFSPGDLNPGNLTIKLYVDIAESEEYYSEFWIRNLMLFDLTETYGANIPSSDDLYSFFQINGFIDTITFDDSGIIGPSQLITFTNETLLSDEILSYYHYSDYPLYISFNNYSESSNIPGVYHVSISYKNYFDQIFTKNISILIIDKECPVIKLSNGSNTIDATISNPLTLAEIRSYLIVTDNTNIDLSQVTIDARQYLDNANRAGKYYFDVSVVDSSGNKTSKRFYIKVINDLGPTVNAPHVIFKSVDIVFNTTDVLNTIKSIVDQDGKIIDLYVGDGLNSDNVKILKDTFTGNANKKGTYYVSLLVWDIQDRKTYHNFTINVLDNIKDLVFYSDTIYIGNDVILTEKDIVKLLNKCGITDLNNDNSYVTFPINEYEQYSYAPGQLYDVKVRFKCANGTEEVYPIQINVSDEESMIINSGFFAKIGRALNRFWDDFGSKIITIIVIISIICVIYYLNKKGYFNKIKRKLFN